MGGREGTRSLWWGLIKCDVDDERREGGETMGKKERGGGRKEEARFGGMRGRTIYDDGVTGWELYTATTAGRLVERASAFPLTLAWWELNLWSSAGAIDTFFVPNPTDCWARLMKLTRFE